jgi:hypothetical protein
MARRRVHHEDGRGGIAHVGRIGTSIRPPAQPRNLRHFLSRQVRRRRRRLCEQADLSRELMPEQKRESKRILIVDDEQTSRVSS